jgi:hypothetical protein
MLAPNAGVPGHLVRGFHDMRHPPGAEQTDLHSPIDLRTGPPPLGGVDAWPSISAFGEGRSLSCTMRCDHKEAFDVRWAYCASIIETGLPLTRFFPTDHRRRLGRYDSI